MTLLRADALNLPLADDSVDRIVTSPPYWGLRSYQDGGEHYTGQIGSEATPAEFVDALLAVTRECRRVLKPSGSMFVNLGDKYAGSGAPGTTGAIGSKQPTRTGMALPASHSGGPGAKVRNRSKVAVAGYSKATIGGARPKSLMGLPWRYANACVDELGMILRAEIVWSKPNGLPESVQDRVRRSHEQWFHLTGEGDYYSAVDELRERHTTDEGPRARRGPSGPNRGTAVGRTHDDGGSVGNFNHDPRGKLPGSVWEVATEPLSVPVGFYARGGDRWKATGGGVAWDSPGGREQRRWLWHQAEEAFAAGERLLVTATDHFAAFPQEWPRRFVLGWSPPGICCECGTGRRPVVDVERSGAYEAQGGHLNGKRNDEAKHAGRMGEVTASIVGYGCDCGDEPTAPTRPAVVLDPFGGTGTTAMVARALGRTGISVDLSTDYLRLARWRIHESGHAAKTVERTNRDRQGVLL
jgi:DNA modification methylase